MKRLVYILSILTLFVIFSCAVHRPAYLKGYHFPYTNGKFYAYSCDFIWSIDIPVTKNVSFHDDGGTFAGIIYTYNDSSIIYVTTKKRFVNYSHIVSSVNAVDSLRRFRNLLYQAALPYKDTLDFSGIDNEGIAWRDRTVRIYSSFFSVGYILKDSTNTKQYDDYIESLKLDYTVPDQEIIDYQIRYTHEMGGDSDFYKHLEDLEAKEKEINEHSKTNRIWNERF